MNAVTEAMIATKMLFVQIPLDSTIVVVYQDISEMAASVEV